MSIETIKIKKIKLINYKIKLMNKIKQSKTKKHQTQNNNHQKKKNRQQIIQLTVIQIIMKIPITRQKKQNKKKIHL